MIVHIGKYVKNRMYAQHRTTKDPNRQGVIEMPDWVGWVLMVMFIICVFINALFHPR